MPDLKPSSDKAATSKVDRLARKGVTRRSVVKLGTLAAAALPLVLTLAPTEARAQDSGS